MSAPQADPAKKPGPGAVLIGFLVLLVGQTIILFASGVISFPQVLPESITPHGFEVRTIFMWILAITGITFVLTEGLLIYFLFKYRARPGGKSVHLHGSHKLELAWTFVPGLILFFLAVFQTGTWSDVKFHKNAPKVNWVVVRVDTGVEGLTVGEELTDARYQKLRKQHKDAFGVKLAPGVKPLVVQVLGQQFEWHFRMAGADGAFGTADDIVKRDELHVVVDRPVLILQQTADVLHSFWIPNAYLKNDLLPGHTIEQWFTPIKTGKYEIVCAELCGAGHTEMRGDLFVHTQEEYDAWVKKRLETSPFEPDDDPVWVKWKEQ